MNSAIFTRSTGTPTLRAAFGVAAGGEDPVAEARAQQHPGGDGGEDQPPDDRHRQPVDRAAAPSGQRSIRPCSASHAEQRRCSDLAGEEPGQPVVARPARLRPEIWVRPVMARVRPMVRPRRTKRPASVTMKEGRPVRTTMHAVEPADERRRRRRRTGCQASSGQPQYWTVGMAMHDAGEADHRADREVELAADHQQRGRDGEDAELGRRPRGS